VCCHSYRGLAFTLPGLRTEKYLIVEVLTSPDAGQKVGYWASKMCGLSGLEFFSFGKKLDSAIGRGMKNPFWWPFLALSAQDVSLRDSFLMKICSLRLIQDEGVLGALRLAKNLLLDDVARERVLAMRWVFERHRRNLSAIYLIAQKDRD